MNPLTALFFYGRCRLTRDQYAHVLSTFSHSSYEDAPRQCLAAFDELQSLGLEAFTKKHDPHWGIPLNKNLPQPVIALSILAIPPGRTANFLISKPPPPPLAAGTRSRNTRGKDLREDDSLI
jgi:hypothetical protein